VGLLIRLLILPFKRPIVGMVIGLVMIGGVLITDWGGDPSCGGKTMQPGDLCHKVSDSTNALDKTYEQEKSSEKPAPYIWGTLGGVLVVAGAGSWAVRRRKATRAAEGTDTAATLGPVQPG
jgi:hypothetical protein